MNPAAGVVVEQARISDFNAAYIRLFYAEKPKPHAVWISLLVAGKNV
jgi:hypothetical protein